MKFFYNSKKKFSISDRSSNMLPSPPQGSLTKICFLLMCALYDAAWRLGDDTKDPSTPPPLNWFDWDAWEHWAARKDCHLPQVPVFLHIISSSQRCIGEYKCYAEATKWWKVQLGSDNRRKLMPFLVHYKCKTREHKADTQTCSVICGSWKRFSFLVGREVLFILTETEKQVLVVAGQNLWLSEIRKAILLPLE